MMLRILRLYSLGSGQGCAVGTFLFCLGLASVVDQLYPELVILSFVDDVVVLVPPPDSSDRGAWEALYRRHACCLADLKRLALGVGLTLNLDKCGLLLPPNRPLPSPAARALFPLSFDFQTQGFRVAGSPVGTWTS